GFAHRRCGHDVYAEPIAILHDRMSSKAEAGFLAPPFLEQLGFRVRGALMRIVAALLAVEIHPPIAAARTLLFVLGPKALHAGPALDQRSVRAEVLVAYPALAASQLHDSRKKD